MLTRDQYISILEKRASGEACSALDDWSKNTSDNRETVGKMFSHTDQVSSDASKIMGKVLPGDTKKESGYMFMKHAMFTIDQTQHLKTASPAYLMAVQASFTREIEKIAAWVGAGSGALTTALDAARKKPATIGGTAQKFMGQYMKPKMAPSAGPLAQGSVASKLPTR